MDVQTLIMQRHNSALLATGLVTINDKCMGIEHSIRDNRLLANLVINSSSVRLRDNFV